MKQSLKSETGFTLIELLVVIAVIGLLASIVLVSLNAARNKAKVSKTAAQLRQLQRATALYFNDTAQMPPSCRLDCTASTDPFLNALGAANWNGPYTTMWNLTHGWGGHIGFQALDWDGNGTIDYGFILDDDRPGTTSSDNGGVIPTASLVEIDKILDDGDLATGFVRGNGLGFMAAAGELVMAFQQ